MKRIIVLLLICNPLFFALQSSSAIPISESSYFSVLTCEPGQDVYARFGHSALRFCDSVNDIDVVYNYGTFSFTDDFVYKFVRGETYYNLSIQTYASFMRSYNKTNRGVVEQILALNSVQKQNLFAILLENSKPEHRTYLYNFLYDNCSTRPKVLLEKLLGDTLRWDSNGVVEATLWHAPSLAQLNATSATWRDYIHAYISKDSWLGVGIYILIGVPADALCSRDEANFLPDNFFSMLNGATIVEQDTQKKLVADVRYISPQSLDTNTKSYPTATLILWIAAFVFSIVSVVEYKKGWRFVWLDALVYLLFGVMGIIVWYVSMVSIHPAVFPNVHSLLFLPTHILFAIVIFISSWHKVRKIYLYISLFMFVIFIAILPLFALSSYHSASYALAIIIGGRLVKEFYYSKLH